MGFRNILLILFTGLSPDLQSMEQIRRIMRPTDVPDQGKAKNKFNGEHSSVVGKMSKC